MLQHPSVSWHIIPLKLFNWNIIFLGQKEQCTIFRLFGALMKVHPIPHVIFETTRSGIIQILHHCSVSWKITPLYFLAQTSYILDKNSPSKWMFWTWTFEWLGEISRNFYFDRLVLLKVYKVSAKKVWRSYTKEC